MFADAGTSKLTYNRQKFIKPRRGFEIISTMMLNIQHVLAKPLLGGVFVRHIRDLRNEVIQIQYCC